MTSTLVWYVARSSGLVLWALLAASVVWGLALSTRVVGRRPRPAWLLDMHRFLGGAALVFLVIHVSSIVLDTYVHFGVVEVLVPFTGTWHPGAVAWGIVAMYLLVAVEVTSLLRSHVPRRVWRLVHVASFPLFAFGTVHALAAGTDRHTVAVRVALLGVTALVAALALVRVTRLVTRVRSARAWRPPFAVARQVGSAPDRAEERPLVGAGAGARPGRRSPSWP